MTDTAPRGATRSSDHTGTVGAELLVDCLVRAGVTTIFGLPGDTGVALYDALYRRAASIRHVLARDERHAAYMADAYARASNTVGVVEVSSGGGTTYAVSGLGEAYAASVPVLVITSDIHTSSRGTGALTEIDQRSLFRAVTKDQFTVDSADGIPAVVSAALAAATSGRPAPVVLIVPEEVLDQPTSARPFDADAALSRLPRLRPEPDAGSISRAAELISAARQPAIVAGSGIHVSQAWGELAALAAHLAIPVATTIQGKGSLPTDSPWSLGIVGGNGGAAVANAYLAGADLVMFVGTRANATDTDGYTAPPRQGPRIIGVDIDAARAGRNFPGSLPVVADAAAALRALLAAASPTSDAERERRLGVIRALAAAREPAATGSPEPVPGGRMHAADVVDTIADALAGRRHVVVADPGTPTPYVANRWPVTAAGRTVLIPRGHGPMGYAIPAAVGVALAEPDAAVVAVAADGGFAMSCGELETVHRLGLPIIYVQLTNYSMGWIKMLQHLYMGERYFGVDPGPIDAVMVARACGLDAVRVESVGELHTEMSKALAERRSLYIDAPVLHMIDDVPPVTSWHAALAGAADRPVY